MSNEEIETKSLEVTLSVHAIDTKSLAKKITEKIANQKKLVKENPFLEIVDNKTYVEAKARRTRYVTARTTEEKEKKALGSNLNSLKNTSYKIYDEDVISITTPHEKKQDDEVKRYENKKAEEKAEKARIEAERLEDIRVGIVKFFHGMDDKISAITIDDHEIMSLSVKEALENYDQASTETHLAYFLEKKSACESHLSSHIQELKSQEAARIEREKLIAEKEIAEKKAKEQEEELRKEREANKKIADQVAAQQKKEREEAAEKQRLIDEENKKIKAELQKLQDEKNEAAKKEADRLAKVEAQKKAKAEAKRLEALKPEKERAASCVEVAVVDFDFPDVESNEINEALKSFELGFQALKENTIKAINAVK